MRSVAARSPVTEIPAARSVDDEASLDHRRRGLVDEDAAAVAVLFEEERGPVDGFADREVASHDGASGRDGDGRARQLARSAIAQRMARSAALLASASATTAPTSVPLASAVTVTPSRAARSMLCISGRHAAKRHVRFRRAHRPGSPPDRSRRAP